MYKYGIVVIGYKNAEGVRRLLQALGQADYAGDKPLLIISIDYSEDDSVYSEAEAFVWRNGEKVIKRYARRQGLRNHVLACGDYMNEFGLDAVAVFEDDMMPSKDFFDFTKQATEKYISNQNIAGISLYTHCINFQTGERFIPMKCDGDNYFFQCAQSRGQVWFKNQWNDFRSWYEKNMDCGKWTGDIPQRVLSWPQTSWLKYHIKYCIDNNKYFVYPYTSYSTCFGDVGQHIKKETNYFQVPLSNMMSTEFKLIEFDEKALKYDAFFENEGIYEMCNMDRAELAIDLYGHRQEIEKRYILTKKKRNYKVIKTWGDKLVPHEMNILYDIPGEEIYLYDMQGNVDDNTEKKHMYNSISKKLIFYGSGIEGKNWLQVVGKENVYGFADSDSGKAGSEICGKRVFSLEELDKMREEIKIFISANSKNKEAIIQSLKQKGLEELIVGAPYINIEVMADLSAKVDKETVFEGKNYIYRNVELAKCRLGYATYIAKNTKLHNVLIGRYSCIGQNVNIVEGQHPTKQFVSISPIFYSADNNVAGDSYVAENMFEEYRFTKNGYTVEIGNDVWIGSNVSIMEGVTIADGTIIAAGANVVKDTEPYSIVGGNPACVIKYRFSKEEIDFLLDFRWWDKSKEWIKENAKYFCDIHKFMNSVRE